MHVIEHLQNASNPTVSVEIIPPKRGGSVAQIHKAIESIAHFRPPFINVTSHAAEVIWEEQPGGSFKRKVKRKSPGTFGLCAAIKYKYEIEPVPHILCGGFTREETEDALIELNYLGIENVLAIRGDKRNAKPIPTDRSENKYASDLVAQINAMNNGRYLDHDMVDAAHTNFCVGVGFYPEKHFEAPNLGFDLAYFKKKIDAGAHYGVSQMFFNNKVYLDFVEQARRAGITAPLVPGLKIMTNKSQLHSLPSAFHIDIPEALCARLTAAKSREEEIEVGIDWALEQSLALLDAGIMYLHFYVMHNTAPFVRLMERLRKKL